MIPPRSAHRSGPFTYYRRASKQPRARASRRARGDPVNAQKLRGAGLRDRRSGLKNLRGPGSKNTHLPAVAKWCSLAGRCKLPVSRHDSAPCRPRVHGPPSPRESPGDGCDASTGAGGLPGVAPLPRATARVRGHPGGAVPRERPQGGLAASWVTGGQKRASRAPIRPVGRKNASFRRRLPQVRQGLPRRPGCLVGTENKSPRATSAGTSRRRSGARYRSCLPPQASSCPGTSALARTTRIPGGRGIGYSRGSRRTLRR